MKNYHYTECGLNNIYLENGFKITKNQDEEEVYIEDIHGLHKMIGISLIFKQGLLSGNEIKFIRHTIDFSQTALAHTLGVDYQTVLGWEKNKRKISKTADHYLKTIFFAYLKKDSPIYELINEIANLSAKEVDEKVHRVTMRVSEQEWHYVDKAA